MPTLSIGKYRGLQQCSSLRGAISVLALDHRNSLRKALDPVTPEAVAASAISAFKREVVEELAPACTAVLLDPEVGAAQAIASGALPGKTGLVCALEATGYTGDPAARRSGILSGWSVEKARRTGASAVKLLVYYHPGASTAVEIEALVRQTASDCAMHDLPLFVEPLSYSLDPAAARLSPQERSQVVIETARRLTPPGVEVLKAEFPIDIQAQPDEKEWAAACGELTQASQAPWVLLSASVSFDTFLRQVTVACRQGACGVAVGRAVWQEAPNLRGEDRRNFLQDIARQRMERITALVEALARPWTDYFQPVDVTDAWYKTC